MPLSSWIPHILTVVGFCSTSIINTVFIYLTVFRIKKIQGAYKKMITIFALIGIVFAFWELLTRPFAHNWRRGLLYFSLDPWIQNRQLLNIALLVYASFYLVILANIAVQFAFRYSTLANPRLAHSFNGFSGVSLWLGYSLVSGAIYGGGLYFLCSPDEFSDEYMSGIIMDTYNVSVYNVSRFAIIPYEEDGSVRLPDLCFLFIGISILGLQYFVIVFCGLKMQRIFKREIRLFSNINRDLQRQFFRALIVQTIVPTVLFVLPIAPFLIGPLLFPVLPDFQLNFPTGWMYVVLCLYPPIDTVAFMCIVSEYKRRTLELFKPVLPKIFRVSSETSTTASAAKHKNYN